MRQLGERQGIRMYILLTHSLRQSTKMCVSTSHQSVGGTVDTATPFV